MPSSDIATAAEDATDSAVACPAADGPPPTQKARHQGDSENNIKEEGARVLFRDEKEFRRKREIMVADGAHQLQVIAGPLQVWHLLLVLQGVVESRAQKSLRIQFTTPVPFWGQSTQFLVFFFLPPKGLNRGFPGGLIRTRYYGGDHS